VRYYFIMNPFAGKGKYGEELRDKINKTCSERGVEYEIIETDSVSSLGNVVKEKAAARGSEEIAFFACGGDGTVCVTVNAIMALEDRSGVNLGIIPVGTGNDFVRNFGEREIFFDISAQLDATALSVDVLRCNDTYSINMINIGFDCEVVCKTVSVKKSPLVPSKLAYIVGLVATLVKKPGVTMKAAVDGGEYEDKKLLLTTFANGEFCGGGFHSNPKASLDDGMIDALFINNVSRMKFISLVGSYKKGTHLDNEKLVNIIKHQKFRSIDMIFDKETNISVDGEVIRAKEAHLSVQRAAFGLLVPKGAKVKNEDSSYIGLAR